MNIDLVKIIDRIYAEEDVSKNLSLSGGGIIALIVYVISQDVALAFLSLVISFPFFRVVIGSIERSYRAKKATTHKSLKYRSAFEKLSSTEREIVAEFLSHGASVLPQSILDNGGLDDAAVRSLINRGILREDIEQGLVMDPEFFSQASNYIDNFGDLKKIDS